MAEAADNGGKKPMNSEQMEIIHTTLDWKSNNHRSAETMKSVNQYQEDSMARTLYNPQKSQKGMPALQKADRSLMYRELDATRDPKAMWTDVSDIVADMKNIDPMIDMWSMSGNVYDHGSYCEFIMGMYEVNKTPIIDFKRMSGDGFVMDFFYRTVISKLLEHKEGLLMPKEEEPDDGADVYFDDYSDDEKDSDDNPHLTSHGYLQLSYDESLVTSWIEKIKTRHVEDRIHLMGLLAYNALHKENLEIIVRRGEKALRDMMQKLLIESNSAALVRNTSALANAVTGHEYVERHEYDGKFVEAIFEAMHHWVPGNGRKQQSSFSFEITESRETVNNLIQALYNLKKYVQETEMIAKASTLNSEEKAPIVAYLEKQTSEENTFLKYILEQTDAT